MKEQELYSYFEKLQIPYSVVEHEAFFTCEASGDFYKDNDMGGDCKSLFLRNRNGKQHYLCVLLSHKSLKITEFAEDIGTHRKMSFASDERLLKFLGLTPGSVTPFGLCNENATGVIAYIDSEIFENEYVHFHPLRNTATVKMKSTDFKIFLESLSQEIHIYNFDKLS